MHKTFSIKQLIALAMNDSGKTVEPTKASELPFGTWLRLIALGATKRDSEGNRIRIEPSFRKKMRRVNAGMPFLFVGLFLPAIIPLSWLNVGIFAVVWVVGNLVVLSRAPLQDG